MRWERLTSEIRVDVRRSWDRRATVALVACLSMVAIEKLWFRIPSPAGIWYPQRFWASVPLAGLFLATALMLARRGGAKILPTLLLLTLIGLARDQVELAVEWFFWGLIWELYETARLLTGILPP